MSFPAAHFKALVYANRARHPRRLPVQVHPTAVARRYFKRLKTPLEETLALVNAELRPYLESLGPSPSRIAHDAAPKDHVGEILDVVRAKVAARWTRERFARVVQPIASDVERFQAGQLNATLRAIVSVDVVGNEPWLGHAIDDFVRENVSLIKSIPGGYLDDLEKNLKRDIADGARGEEIGALIQDRYGVAESRAQLIARDQVGKFNGDLNRVRQVDLGIERFVWRTSEDERVRPEHEAIDGEEFGWDSGAPGEGFPGEPILCRCSAEPDLSAILEGDV